MFTKVVAASSPLRPGGRCALARSGRSSSARARPVGGWLTEQVLRRGIAQSCVAIALGRPEGISRGSGAARRRDAGSSGRLRRVAHLGKPPGCS